jgi:hypothetical protein
MNVRIFERPAIAPPPYSVSVEVITGTGASGVNQCMRLHYATVNGTNE